MVKSLIGFIKSSFKEINPWTNIQLLHTNVRGDILAGIIVAIIALPLALAFGEVSQLGAKAGLWSAVVGGLIGGLFGGCLVGVSGPTMPMASQIAAFGVVIGSGSPDLTSAFSIIFLSGLILTFFSILKISRFIYFVPYSAIAGFMCGIAAIVILGQINPFIGIQDVDANRPIWVIKNFFQSMQNININVLYVSLPSLILLLIWPLISKKNKFINKIPSPLPALIMGSFIAYFIDLKSINPDYFIASINSASLKIYQPDLSRITEYIGPAFVLASLAVIDSLLSCRVADTMTGTRHSSDRETFGQGMANMASGFVGGISTATATTQTVGNVTFGAKTPFATMIKGFVMLLVIVFLGKLVSYIPIACLAAILFKLGIDILDYRVLPVLKRLPLTDLFIFCIVFFTTIFANLITAVGIGVLFAILRYSKEVMYTFKSSFKHKIISFSDSDLMILNKKEIDHSFIKVLRPEGPLFFGSVESLIKVYNFAPKHKVLIVDISLVSIVDLSGVYALEDLIKSAQKNNVEVLVFNPNSNVKEIMQRVNFLNNIGESKFLNTKEKLNSRILKKT
tara:strand:+ start:3526 stop:5223 length:1698 start_codon:yes stop_codon:yes gene_type:complete